MLTFLTIVLAALGVSVHLVSGVKAALVRIVVLKGPFPWREMSSCT